MIRKCRRFSWNTFSHRFHFLIPGITGQEHEIRPLQPILKSCLRFTLTSENMPTFLTKVLRLEVSLLLDSPNGRPNHHTQKSRSEIQERFHVTSWTAYLFSKRMKRRSCWFFKPKAFFLFQCICAEHVSVNALLAPCGSIIKTKFITGFILPNSLLFSV